MSGYIGSKASVTQVDGYNRTEADAAFVQDPNGAITVSGSNVGIGTDSPAGGLQISATFPTLLLDETNTDAAYQQTQFGIDNGSFRIQTRTSTNAFVSNDYLIDKDANGATDHIWRIGNSEAMRITSTGALLVGKTSANNTTAGTTLWGNGLGFSSVRNGNTVAILNRLTNDGDIMQFRKDGSTVGSIGIRSGVTSYIVLDPRSGGTGLSGGTRQILPTNTSGTAVDNVADLGASTVRWDDIYATNGNIQTSDANEKQDIASLTATEMLVAARISGLFKTFRWIDSVADKGDNARTHTGVIAQDVQAAFIAEGLDAGDYALFTSATWWETQTDVPAVVAVAAVDATYDDDGNELTAAVEAVEAADAYTRTDTYETLAEAPAGATERTRMGIRYPELLAFVGAYNEQRFASIETRLAALEAV